MAVKNKVLTFASAFETKAFKEEFFERFRYEQASSTRLVNEEWRMNNEELGIQS